MAGVTTTGHSDGPDGPVVATEGDYYIPQSYFNAETTADDGALAGHTNTYNRTAAPGELTPVSYTHLTLPTKRIV